MPQASNADRLVRISDFPQSSIGAPCPFLLASEGTVCLIFYTENPTEEGTDNSPRSVELSNGQEPLVVLTLSRCYAHQFGPPNDESLAGHPLYRLGLRPYSAFKVENSSWISDLEKRNSVHRSHDRVRFLSGKIHYIFTFHDSTFECVASGYNISVGVGSIATVAARTLQNFR